jgi:hypothetical protein
VLILKSLELLGFTTLDAMVSQIRGEVDWEIFARIDGRISPEERARLAGVLEARGTGGMRMFTRLKKPEPPGQDRGHRSAGAAAGPVTASVAWVRLPGN